MMLLEEFSDLYVDRKVDVVASYCVVLTSEVHLSREIGCRQAN